MTLHYFKAFHIIGFVVWFAGLFYLVRLLIYHTEAQSKDSNTYDILHKQFSTMEKRLMYIITWPGMVITIFFGIGMLIINPYYLGLWLYVKLLLIAFLIVYHLFTEKFMKKLINEKSTLTTGKLRLWNELATLLLISIVFLAVLKNMIDFFYGLLGFILVALLLFAGIKFYKKYRRNKLREK